jgi:hypothetical protein
VSRSKFAQKLSWMNFQRFFNPKIYFQIF